jgi:hypothetical protein
MPLEISYPFKRPKAFADPHKAPAYPCDFPGCRYTDTDRDGMEMHILSVHMRHSRDNYISARRGYERVMREEMAATPRLQPQDITHLGATSHAPSAPTPYAQHLYARKVA